MPRIAINAGHYPGLDSGAVGVSGSHEANIVKDIATVVCDDLNAIGYETLFIQENELQDICDASNNFNADLFVSIHCNSAANDQAEGVETFYCDGSVNGEKLANCIQNQLVSSLGSIDRGLKVGGLYVTKHTDAPAVLTEIGFISNAAEERIILSNIDNIAHAIARGISDFFW